MSKISLGDFSKKKIDFFGANLNWVKLLYRLVLLIFLP